METFSLVASFSRSETIDNQKCLYLICQLSAACPELNCRVNWYGVGFLAEEQSSISVHYSTYCPFGKIPIFLHYHLRYRYLMGFAFANRKAEIPQQDESVLRLKPPPQSSLANTNWIWVFPKQILRDRRKIIEIFLVEFRVAS